MRNPLTGRTPEQEQEALEWAIEVVEELKDADSLEDADFPERPRFMQREKAERERAEQRRRERVESGEYEHVLLERACIGLGPVCVRCGEEMPEPGAGPRRCPSAGE